jgi:hypothetical protein
MERDTTECGPRENKTNLPVFLSTRHRLGRPHIWLHACGCLHVQNYAVNGDLLGFLRWPPPPSFLCPAPPPAGTPPALLMPPFACTLPAPSPPLTSSRRSGLRVSFLPPASGISLHCPILERFCTGWTCSAADAPFPLAAAAGLVGQREAAAGLGVRSRARSTGSGGTDAKMPASAPSSYKQEEPGQAARP